MNVKPDHFIKNLYNKTNNEQKVFDDFHDHRQFIKKGLKTSLGDFFDYYMEGNSESSVVTEVKEFDDYIRERIIFHASKDLAVPVYVLTPKNGKGKFPAVLAVHGHGYGSKEIVGLTKEGEEDTGEPGIHQHFAVNLVKRGLKVFAPEVIGFGERMLERDIKEGKPKSCESMGTNLLMAGKTLAGLRVFEAIQTIDFIETFEDVLKDRIGVMGFSGGGLISAYTAALDKRLKAVVLCGFTNTFQGSILAMRHCIDNYLPGILQYAELPELIGLIAPRALFIESGTHDPIFPVEHTKKAISKLTDIYANLEAENAIESDIFEGSHEISGRKSYDWLKNRLITE